MKPWINYHHLQYFYVIATEGGVAKAARRLKLGQSTLSMQLKQFEEVLGKKLFTRADNRLELTEEGKITFRYAKDIFSLGEQLLETLADQKSAEVSHLQIGALDVLPKALIFKLIEAAQSEHNCFVSVLEGSFEFLCRELSAHKVDLLLTDSPVTGGNGEYRSRKIGEYSLNIIGAKNYASLKKNFPKSLKGQAFVLPTVHSRLRQELNHWFESQEIQIHCIAETQDLEVQKFFVKSGQALAAFPEPSIIGQEWAKDLKVFTRLEHIKEEVWLSSVHRKIGHSIGQKLMNGFKL